MSNDLVMKIPKKHCMVVHHYYPLAEPRVEREAQALIRHGYQVDVICLKAEGELDFEVVDGVNVYRLPVRRDKRRGLVAQLLEYLSFMILAFFKLVRLYGEKRYSVIQAHNLPNFLVFAALWPKLMGARVILDIHDLMPEFYAVRFHRDMQSWPVRLNCLEERISCRFADHVITVTEHWRKALINRGVPSAKVSVVMNVPDNHVFYPIASRDRPDKVNGYFNLIYHGTLARRYGIDLLIRAIDILRKDIPTIHLTVHGGGEFQRDLVKLVGELELENHVSFSTHLLPMSELPGFISKADVGVVPYRTDLFTDGILPTKLMEYVALDLPVVVARTPAIAAYFDESMVQFFTPGSVEELADSIRSLFEDRSRLTSMVENGKRFSQAYSWEKVARDYVALVDRLNSQQIRG